MGRKKDQIRELVKESIKEEMRDTGVIDDTSEESHIIPTEDLPESVKPLLSSFPSAEGYFGKIYKIEENGEWRPMDYRIESPETIPGSDLEGEVHRIVKEKKWGNGNYRIQIRRQGERSLYLNKKVLINDPPEFRPDEHNPIREQFGILSEAVSITERLKPAPVDISGIMKETREAMKEGRTMSKGGDGSDGQLISLIKELSPIITPFLARPQINEDSIIEKIVARLQPTLQPKEDKLSGLVELKKALGFQFAHEVKKEDSLDSVRKVAEIVSAIKPLTQAASGEPPSTLGLLLEHLPRLVEPLLTTFKEFAEAKKMEMQLRMEQYYGGGQPAQIEGGRERNLPATRIHPFAARIINAVNKNDESYFDMMRQQISRLYGQHVIDGLVDGNLTTELVIETIHMELGVPLNLQNIKPYFDKFIKYLQGKHELENGKGVLTECKLCHAQYDFPDIKAWETDSKRCEDCQGDLEVVKREGEA